jgi:hypothetical protein
LKTVEDHEKEHHAESGCLAKLFILLVALLATAFFSPLLLYSLMSWSTVFHGGKFLIP